MLYGGGSKSIDAELLESEAEDREVVRSLQSRALEF
jgi:hypothetical protein